MKALIILALVFSSTVGLAQREYNPDYGKQKGKVKEKKAIRQKKEFKEGAVAMLVSDPRSKSVKRSGNRHPYWKIVTGRRRYTAVMGSAT